MKYVSQQKLFNTILVTGGAGYVGSDLVPALLDEGYRVKVVDLFWYGKDVFPGYESHPALELIELDIRDREKLTAALAGVDAVIHLACISNDPSFELDGALGKSINYDAFGGLLGGSLKQGVKRFIYASSSSIYGLKDTPDVREDEPPLPLTDYSKFKLACEHDLLNCDNPNKMDRIIIRPSTVCGYAPRLRLDLTVNILTAHALVNKKIRIFGGKQLRPNLHIKDMTRSYLAMLLADSAKVDGQAFNVGFQNRAVEDIAHIVKDTLGDPDVTLEYVPSSDNRSYHVNSDKIRDSIGFTAIHTIEDAVRDLAVAYRAGKIPNALTDIRYSNIQTMKALGVK
jgi:nucleoside-diphosphate-sugar epimerase